MKKTVSAHVYNTIERYPQILKMPKVEKAMGNLKCWMALRVNRGFDNSSHGSSISLCGLSVCLNIFFRGGKEPVFSLKGFLCGFFSSGKSGISGGGVNILAIPTINTH